MAREPVFYSFHFDNDVMRVQQIRQMGVVTGDEPVSPNDWEKIKRSGDTAVQKWIDENMKHRRAVAVLVGAKTSERPWVRYEIKKAWEERRGLFGIYIHNLRCPREGLSPRGANPFDCFKVGGSLMSSLIRCYEPEASNAYGDISARMAGWVADAISQAKTR